MIVLRRTVPLLRRPIARWRAGAGAAVYVGDTNINNVDNHLSLMLRIHSTNGKLQFMQRESRQSTTIQLDFNKLNLELDRHNFTHVKDINWQDFKSILWSRWL